MRASWHVTRACNMGCHTHVACLQHAPWVAILGCWRCLLATCNMGCHTHVAGLQHATWVAILGCTCNMGCNMGCHTIRLAWSCAGEAMWRRGLWASMGCATTSGSSRNSCTRARLPDPWRSSSSRLWRSSSNSCRDPPSPRARVRHPRAVRCSRLHSEEGRACSRGRAGPLPRAVRCSRCWRQQRAWQAPAE